MWGVPEELAGGLEFHPTLNNSCHLCSCTFKFITPRVVRNSSLVMGFGLRLPRLQILVLLGVT